MSMIEFEIDRFFHKEFTSGGIYGSTNFGVEITKDKVITTGNQKQVGTFIPKLAGSLSFEMEGSFYRPDLLTTVTSEWKIYEGETKVASKTITADNNYKIYNFEIDLPVKAFVRYTVFADVSYGTLTTTVRTFGNVVEKTRDYMVVGG